MKPDSDRVNRSFVDPAMLLEEALRLSSDTRAALAGALLQSLDEQIDADAEAAWQREIERRLETLDSGAADAVPWSEARRMILGKRCSRSSFDPEAVAEARSAREWYEARNPASAAALVRELYEAIEQIGRRPDQSSKYTHGTREYLLHKFPFSIVYRDLVDRIQIVALVRTHRHPGYWKKPKS